MKILIVDDEKEMQRLFEQRFRKERRNGQVTLYFAFSGEEALNFLQQKEGNELTMILSDINMPKMSGLELLKIVKGLHPDLAVYIVTAYGDEKNRLEALKLGASDYLTKPIDFNSLKDKIFTNLKI